MRPLPSRVPLRNYQNFLSSIITYIRTELGINRILLLTPPPIGDAMYLKHSVGGVS